MKFTIDRDALKGALANALKGMDASSAMPILSGILMTAQDGMIQFENTNMEVSIRQRCIANVEEPGQVVAPCKLLSDIVGRLPAMAIKFTTDGTQLGIQCGSSSYTIDTLPVCDFPNFPSYELDSTVEVPTDSLSEMVNRVAVAADTNRLNSILSGVLVSITNESVRFVTTDSVRLAVAEAPLVSEVDNFEIIAPAKSLRSVLSLASSAKTITIGTNHTQIVFMFGEVVYVSRRIEGTYPNYRKLIPASHATGVRVKMNALHEAMQRIKAMTIANSEVCFKVDVAGGLLTITSNLPGQGNAREELDVQADGEDITIAFNSRYIFDCLQKADAEAEVSFEAESPFRPGVFRSTSGKIDFLYLVMPVRPNF